MGRIRRPMPALIGAVLLCAWAAAVAPPAAGSDSVAAAVDPVTAAAEAPAEEVPVVTGDGTAATAQGWGTPLPTSDEFDYTGAPDRDRWKNAPECWPGHDGNGRRCGSRATVENGHLRITGLENGDSGWVRHRTDQMYGRWEARIRVVADGESGAHYHPVLLTWPESGRDPQGGEYDFFEGDVGVDIARAFIHHPTESGVVQDRYTRELDFSEWHTFALEWQPDRIVGYIDGELWFENTDPAAQAPEPMHGTVQLDNFFHAGGMQPAHMDVDWYRVYAPS